MTPLFFFGPKFPSSLLPLTLILLLLHQLAFQKHLARSKPLDEDKSSTAEQRGEFAYKMGQSDEERQDKDNKLYKEAFLSLEPSLESSRRPTATRGGREERQNDDEDEEEERTQIWLARDGDRMRSRHRMDQQKQAAGDQRDQEERRPLRDGDTLLSLTKANVINSTVQSNNCRGELFKHRIRVEGCRPTTFVNRFCHGSCASFYIPRLRSNRLKATFQSCAACVPSETDLIHVRMDCPGRPVGELYRSVVRVKRCACRNVVVSQEDDADE